MVRQFFHNIMKPRKLLTEITGQGGLRKQRSEIINTKYFTSHESTSFTSQINTSVDHFSSISLKDCLEELNSHVFQQRSLKPAFVLQIKRYLAQLARNDRASQDNLQNRRVSKDCKCEDKFHIRSPYIVNRSLKKSKAGMVDFDTAEFTKKTLRKRKMNFDNNNNGQDQIITKSKRVTSKMENKIVQRVQQLRQYCKGLNQQATLLRTQFVAEVQGFKNYLSEQMQKIGQIASRKFRNLLIGVKKQHFQRESSLSDNIKQLEGKIKEVEKRQHVLRDYLKQREEQLVACWSALNLHPL